MSADGPLVTIGITCFNAEDTIGRAVRSALEQEWARFEIVIIDDHSTDSSWNRIEEIRTQCPELVRAYRMERNAGVATCRNRIIQEARGEYICFFDDDDVSVPARIATQYCRISDYERRFGVPRAMILCHSARLHVFPDGRQQYFRTVGMNEADRAPIGDQLARRILTGRPVADGQGACPTCSQMASKEFYRLLGGFDENLRRGEDTDLCIRAALAGCHVVGVSAVLVRQYMTLTSDKPLCLERKSWAYIFAKHFPAVKRWGWHAYAPQWTNAKFDYLQGRYVRFLACIFRLMLFHPVLTLKRVCWSVPGWMSHVRFDSWRRSVA